MNNAGVLSSGPNPGFLVKQMFDHRLHGLIYHVAALRKPSENSAMEIKCTSPAVNPFRGCWICWKIGKNAQHLHGMAQVFGGRGFYGAEGEILICDTKTFLEHWQDGVPAAVEVCLAPFSRQPAGSLQSMIRSGCILDSHRKR